MEVKVGRGVKVSVGGNVAVAVGIAACVKVSMVHALATAVFAISSALKVGSGAGPQADTRITIKIDIRIGNFLFIFFSIGRYFYHKLMVSKPSQKSDSPPKTLWIQNVENKPCGHFSGRGVREGNLSFDK